ncbi:DUF1330 domain-containing protein [Clavibacter zhangzhiyongii]|uniref:DUF1330 domain-containing protein n=1 Tax=Clavibacter zhangzhiyongii TaxID=2768071 RepID=UPI0039E1044A
MSDTTTSARIPAYSITEVLEILDPAGAQRYAELTPRVVERFGGRFVVMGASPVAAEGDAGIAVAVVAWPDMESLTTWYDSPTTPRPARSPRPRCGAASPSSPASPPRSEPGVDARLGSATRGRGCRRRPPGRPRDDPRIRALVAATGFDPSGLRAVR